MAGETFGDDEEEGETSGAGEAVGETSGTDVGEGTGAMAGRAEGNPEGVGAAAGRTEGDPEGVGAAAGRTEDDPEGVGAAAEADRGGIHSESISIENRQVIGIDHFLFFIGHASLSLPFSFTIATFDPGTVKENICPSFI